MSTLQFLIAVVVTASEQKPNANFGSEDPCALLASWTIGEQPRQLERKFAEARKVLARKYQTLVDEIGVKGWRVVIEGSPPLGFAASSQPVPESKTVRLSLAQPASGNGAPIALNPDGVAIRACTILHELSNCLQMDVFVQVEDEAAARKITEDEYVDREITLEVMSTLNAYRVFRNTFPNVIREVDRDGTNEMLKKIDHVFKVPVEQHVNWLKGGVYGDYYRKAYRGVIDAGHPLKPATDSMSSRPNRKGSQERDMSR